MIDLQILDKISKELLPLLEKLENIKKEEEDITDELKDELLENIDFIHYVVTRSYDLIKNSQKEKNIVICPDDNNKNILCITHRHGINNSKMIKIIDHGIEDSQGESTTILFYNDYKIVQEITGILHMAYTFTSVNEDSAVFKPSGGRRDKVLESEELKFVKNHLRKIKVHFNCVNFTYYRDSEEVKNEDIMEITTIGQFLDLYGEHPRWAELFVENLEDESYSSDLKSGKIQVKNKVIEMKRDHIPTIVSYFHR